MLAGLLGIPRMLRKRRAVQRTRRVDTAYLLSVLTEGNAEGRAHLDEIP
jgi:hypothetical protein